MMTGNYWETLRIAPTHDRQRIRDAYIDAIAGLHPARDTAEFQRLRHAYEQLIGALTLPEFRVAGDRGQPTLEPYINLKTVREPENTASYYIEKLTERLKFDGQQSAVFYLEKIIKEQDFNDPSLRMEFEQQLQYLLASVVPFPPQLAQRAVELFQWHNTPKKSMPCHLGAVSMLLTHHKAQQQLQALADIAKQRRERNSRPARALLGRYRPWYFRWLALNPHHLRFVHDWISEFEQEYPDLLPTMIDPQVLGWWKKAAFSPRLLGRHLLNAASASAVCTLAVLGLGGFLSAERQLNGLLPAALFTLLLLSFAGLQYLFVRLSARIAPLRSGLQKACAKVFALCSEHLHTQLTVTPIFVLSFALSILLDGAMSAFFAVLSYGLLLAVFGISLFMIINFIALVLSFIYSSQPWVQHLVASSKFKLHSFSVLDIVVSYFIINTLLILAGSALRVVLGIRKEFQVDQVFYGFLILTLILILHSVIFGMLTKF